MKEQLTTGAEHPESYSHFFNKDTAMEIFVNETYPQVQKEKKTLKEELDMFYAEFDATDFDGTTYENLLVRDPRIEKIKDYRREGKQRVERHQNKINREKTRNSLLFALLCKEVEIFIKQIEELRNKSVHASSFWVRKKENFQSPRAKKAYMLNTLMARKSMYTRELAKFDVPLAKAVILKLADA